MKILFIASRFPYPLVQGDRLRTYHFLRLLSERHEITLVVPLKNNQELKNLPVINSFCSHIVTIKSSLISRFFSLVRIPFTNLPIQVIYFLNHKLYKGVREILAQNDFDLIHVQLARMAPLTEKCQKVPKVLDFIDALSLNMKRRSIQEKGIKRLLFNYEYVRMKEYEQDLIKKFDQLIITSEIDREAIGDFETLQVIPNGVDFNTFPFVLSGREPNTIIFTGNMGYFPNINAVQYFSQEIFPLVKKVIPQAQFIVVGPNIPHEVRQQLLQPGITVTGFVENVHDYIRKASVSVAPMRSGSGIQNKVLEAMSTGTPIVATPFAIGALPVESGRHMLIAADAKEFSESVIRLLISPTLHKHISEQARLLVEQDFDWNNSVELLESAYEKSVQQFHEKV